MANTAARLRGYHHQHRTSAHNKAMHALGSRQIGKTACGGCPMGGRVPLSTLVYWFAAHDTYVKCPINFPISQVGTLPRLIERDCESPTGCLGCAPDHLQLHSIEGRRRAALLPQMFQQKFLTSSFLWIKKETWFICFWEGALEAETTHLHQHPSLLHCIPFYLSPTLFSSLHSSCSFVIHHLIQATPASTLHSPISPVLPFSTSSTCRGIHLASSLERYLQFTTR